MRKKKALTNKQYQKNIIKNGTVQEKENYEEKGNIN